jgi:hypothetical protein
MDQKKYDPEYERKLKAELLAADVKPQTAEWIAAIGSGRLPGDNLAVDEDGNIVPQPRPKEVD